MHGASRNLITVFSEWVHCRNEIKILFLCARGFARGMHPDLYVCMHKSVSLLKKNCVCSRSNVVGHILHVHEFKYRM